MGHVSSYTNGPAGGLTTTGTPRSVGGGGRRVQRDVRRRSLAWISGLVVAASVAGASERSRVNGGGVMDLSAEAYVKLVLALGEHDPDYVDAYYGPPAWKKDVAAEHKGLDQIRADATGLLKKLEGVHPDA